jgi:hypothetical protein
MSFHSAITMLQAEQVAESLSLVGSRLIVTSPVGGCGVGFRS